MPLPDVDVLDGLDPSHEQQLQTLFANQWWTADRSVERVRAAVLASSFVLSAVDRERKQLVGFARVLTDGEFVALVLDVVVADAWRGLGVGARLLDRLVAHPLLADVESIELVCRPHLLDFYARWGFTDQVGSSRLMRRTDRPSLLGEPDR
jgi:GNAT superfamily N-acetyltransferase